MATAKDVFNFIGRNSKRIAVTVVGAAVVVVGLALLVLPGPGVVVVVLGLAILATEFAWAATALEKTKTAAEAAGRQTKKSAGTIKRKVTGQKGPPRVQ